MVKFLAIFGVIVVVLYWLRPTLLRRWSRELWPRLGQSIPGWWRTKSLGQQVTTTLFWLAVASIVYMVFVGYFNRMH